MNGALFAKAVNDSKLLFAAVLVLMFGFPCVFLWASGMISLPAFSEFLTNVLPKEWERVWGVPISQVVTPAGRVALLYVHPLVVTSAMAWALTRGSDCVSGEIGRGTMEMLLAQPVRRTTLYVSHALATNLGSLLLAIGLFCGTAIGLQIAPLYADVSTKLFVLPAINLFALMVCMGGMAAMASSWESQRWRTVGLVGTVFVASWVASVVANIEGRWRWVRYLTVLTAYRPQSMVARWDTTTWSLVKYRDGQAVGVGLAGLPLVLIAWGLVFYAVGAWVFSRREVPAPL